MEMSSNKIIESVRFATTNKIMAETEIINYYNEQMDDYIF